MCVGAGAGVADGGPHPHAGLHRAPGLPERGGPHPGQPLLDDGGGRSACPPGLRQG